MCARPEQAEVSRNYHFSDCRRRRTGSRRQHAFREDGEVEGWDIEAALNNDIVGGDRSAGQDAELVRVFSESIPLERREAHLRRIRAWAGKAIRRPSTRTYVAQTARTYLTRSFSMLVFRHDRYLRGGDHSSFNEQGFPAVRFTEFRENYNHQHQNVRTENGIEYGDLPKYVDYDYVANVARLNAATLASLASAPAPRKSAD